MNIVSLPPLPLGPLPTFPSGEELAKSFIERLEFEAWCAEQGIDPRPSWERSPAPRACHCSCSH